MWMIKVLWDNGGDRNLKQHFSTCLLQLQWKGLTEDASLLPDLQG